MEVYLQQKTWATMRTPIVLDEFISFRWRRKYYNVGEFELHILNTPQNLSEITTYSTYVWFKGSVERGMVERMEITRDKIILSGRLETKKMSKKVVRKLIVNKAVPLVMAEAFGSPGLGRPTQNDSSVTQKANVQWRWNTLLDVEMSLARAYNIGFYQRENTLYLYDGIDRSVNQTENRPIVFLDEDLIEPSWILDDSDHYDYAYIAGEGEGDDRIYTMAGIGGEDELYVDARDLTQGEQTKDEYILQLSQRGLEALAEHVSVDVFEASISAGSQYQYGKDYGLGDVVTLQMSNWGKRQDFRITEVEEVWENGTKTTYPVFGNPLPETLKIQR